MKKYALVAILFFCREGMAQPCTDLNLGTKTPYSTHAATHPASPAGYTAVFINHAGRHGARHMTKDLSESDSYHLLQTADSMHALSASGRELWQMVQRLNVVEHTEVKNISRLGKQEQQGIGERMGANYPTVFAVPHPALNVTVTKEIRTLQSADAFLAGLKNKITLPVMRLQINDTTLRFYDLSPAYQQFKDSGRWTATLRQLEAAEKFSQLSAKAADRFFTPDYMQGTGPAGRQSFAADVVGYANILHSLPAELKEAGLGGEALRFTRFFSCDELRAFSRIDNAEEFLVKGPGTDPAGLQVRIAAPLLIDFIRTTDNYISAQPYQAELRFTHAEAIAPFAALMGIQGASTPAKTGPAIATAWNAAKVVPLSANIQWILYKKKGSHNYMIKFLLNEQEARIEGLAAKQFPYYAWKDVRKFYLNKLQQIKASLNTDGITYLRGLSEP